MPIARTTDTGFPDHVYDLVLLLQQAAADIVRYEAFARDAAAADDAELSTWLLELADTDREVVARATRMLRTRIGD